MSSIVILFNDRGKRVDGVRDHTRMLAAALERATGRPVRSRLRVGGPRSAGIWGLADRRGGGGDKPVVILQYSPFCYARWGLAPWLPATVLALRLRRGRPVLVLNVHEPYVPFGGWRATAMGLWQRAQLMALRLGADVAFSSIEPWAESLSAVWPGRPVHHLPVGSNLPDRREARAAERRRLGVDGEVVVLACFGRDHPAWLPGHVVGAANALARDGREVVMLSLGAEAPALAGLAPPVRVEAPGFLDGADLAARLAAADIFVSPLNDGVSTRRGTLMAALQHGVAVVGTDGPLTDPILRASPEALRLVPVDDPGALAASVCRLAAEPAERRSIGSAGRRLYECNFDWPRAAERILAELPREIRA